MNIECCRILPCRKPWLSDPAFSLIGESEMRIYFFSSAKLLRSTSFTEAYSKFSVSTQSAVLLFSRRWKAITLKAPFSIFWWNDTCILLSGDVMVFWGLVAEYSSCTGTSVPLRSCILCRYTGTEAKAPSLLLHFQTSLKVTQCMYCFQELKGFLPNFLTVR